MIRLVRALPVFVSGIVLAAMSIAQTPPVPSPPPPSSPAPQQAAPESAARPTAAARDHAMEGLAAYYSRRLHGRRTASGRAFDQNGMTAAHPTLPFGTRVKVTNTRNHRTAIVRINDRGPTQSGRVIDLSRAAAKKLGIRRAGVIPVRLEVVSAPARRGPR
jgi:rare lipoprotein A